MLLAFDPDSFSQLQRCVHDETPSPSLKNILALVRLSRYESEVFYKFKQVLVDHIPYANDKMQSDFKSDILKIARNFYPLSTSKDVDFDLGRLSMGLRDYETSIELFKKSMELCGNHYVTWHNLGICYYYIDNLQESMNSFDNCLRIQPEYQDAKWVTSSPLTVGRGEPGSRKSCIPTDVLLFVATPADALVDARTLPYTPTETTQFHPYYPMSSRLQRNRRLVRAEDTL